MNPVAIAAVGTLLCPTYAPTSSVRVSLHNTGWMDVKRSKVLNGPESGEIPFAFPVGHIQHPDGDILVDAGLGSESRNGTYPFWATSPPKAQIGDGMTVAEHLEGPPKIVLLTHMHSDHISGLLDLDERTTVWVTQAEWAHAHTGNPAFNAKRFRSQTNWNPVSPTHGSAQQILGRPALDVVGDQTIWYLSTPGHTPGSASVLVRAADQVWLFVGDIAWVNAHLNDRRRPWPVRWVVDSRPRFARAALAWAREVKRQCPEIQIVAGHEAEWFSR